MNAQGQVRSGSKATADAGRRLDVRLPGRSASTSRRSGRFISDSDNETRRRVAVIGEQVRADLSLPEDPIGEYIQFNGEWLRVIGLLEAKGEIFGQSQDNSVIIPFNTLASLQGNQRQPDMWIRFTVRDLDGARQHQRDDHAAAALGAQPRPRTTRTTSASRPRSSCKTRSRAS